MTDRRPMIFQNDRSFRQLEMGGVVVTFREREMPSCPVYIKRERTGEKEFHAVRAYLFRADPAVDTHLKPFAVFSGFHTVTDWQEAIYELTGDHHPGHLYVVSREGNWKEDAPWIPNYHKKDEEVGEQ